MKAGSKIDINLGTLLEALQLYFDQKVFLPTCRQKVVSFSEAKQGGYGTVASYTVEVERMEDIQGE